jgi:hypothetical protein
MRKHELYDLHSSSNIIRVIKSRRMRWAGHVERMRERRGAYRFWWGNLRDRDHFENLGVNGRVMLKWIFKQKNGMMRRLC